MKNLDLDFMALLMDKTGFPQEAKASLLESARAMEDKGQAPALLEALDAFYQNGFSTKDAQPAIDAMAEKAALSPYTVWMLFLMQGARRAKEDYEKKGVGEEIFWALPYTMEISRKNLLKTKTYRLQKLLIFKQ